MSKSLYHFSQNSPSPVRMMSSDSQSLLLLFAIPGLLPGPLFVLIPHRLLNTAQGSLLDDEKLVNTLQLCKTTALEVEEQLEISVQTEQKIDTAREVSWTREFLFPMLRITLAKFPVIMHVFCRMS